MSTPSTIERSERLTLADMVIVDADVHVNDTPGALAPYCDLPWRMSLESLAGASYPYLLVPGFAPNLRQTRRSRAATPIARSTRRQRCEPS